MLLLAILIVCALLTLICYLGTGSDEKNMKSFSSYPEKIQERIRKNPALSPMIKETSPAVSFISNFVMFLVVFFLVGLMFKTDSFGHNFLYLFILGVVVNLYDLIVLDFLWWRNSKRPRLSGTGDMVNEYKDMTPHIKSALRAIPMFLLVALAVAGIWMLF